MVMIENIIIDSKALNDSCKSIITLLFPEGTPSIMLCSLAGTALYVLTTENHEYWKQIIFSIVSFFGGIHSAGTASEIIATVINYLLHNLNPSVLIEIPHPVGALVASSVFVTILLKFLNRYHIN